MSASLMIAWTSLSELIADGVEDLAVDHWGEAENADPPLDIDYERGFYMERLRQLRVASMKRDGELIGYAAWNILNGFFYRSTNQAFCTAWYVLPRYRGFAVVGLLRWCEQRLKEIGVRQTYIAAKTDRQRDFLIACGYSQSEVMMAKLLGASRHVERTSTATLPAA